MLLCFTFIKGFTPGKYKIIQNLEAGANESIFSTNVKTFEEGDFVNIISVKNISHEGRIRGKVDTVPECWITLINTEDGYTWVEQIKVTKLNHSNDE